MIGIITVISGIVSITDSGSKQSDTQDLPSFYGQKEACQ